MAPQPSLIRRGRRRTAVVLALAFIAPLLGNVRTPVATASPNEYVTMPDGIRIAINVRMPDSYVPGQTYPTLFEMSGYDGGGAEDGTLSKDIAKNFPNEIGSQFPLQDDSRQLSRRFNADYVTIHASVRGTGCSGGEFDLFAWQAALDGRYIIDSWIAQQPWSNGDVALMGHSYGGITGFMIAETQPTHLRAATLSGLIDDLYRGITYPGGVTNYGFPLLWTGAIRPFYDVGGGLAPGLVRDEQPDDTPNRRQKCAENTAAKKRTVTNDPLVQGVTDTDSPWFQARSLIYNVSSINVPMHITGAYQDEQTGPRGPTHLWEQVSGVPKRLVITNGNHDTNNPAYTGPEVWADRKAWVDHWLRGIDGGFGTLAAKKTSVTTLLEYHRDSAGQLTSNGRIDTKEFPLEGTQWQDWYLHASGGLSAGAPTGAEASDQYVSGSPRQGWSYQAGPAAGSEFTTPEGPDEVNYRSAPLAADTTVVGPITADLFISSTAPDTELFVQLIDEGPDGSHTYLQRGMLRASHRAIDPGLSDYDAGGHMYRPWRPHSNADLITPGQVYDYLVEVFPVGHVFRAGHRIQVKVHTPPAVDSYYAYVPKRVPAVNTILHDADHPSRITLPVVATPALGSELPCGAQENVRCIAG
jgi:putative CocE/NonD family hydrolase